MAPTTLDEETAKKVIRQVEFYFSDSNLPRDKFLSEKTSESDDGLVSVALVCSFSRMRSHLGLGDVKPEDVSEDTVKAVAECLRTTSTFLKVSEDGKKVGRANSLPEEVIKLADERTIAASPLEYDVKIEDVESFFRQHAEVCSVRLPRLVADKRLFCGTALIELSTEDAAQQILKETLTYSGVELELKPKKDFDTERAKQKEEFAKTQPREGSHHKEKANFVPDYPIGLIIAFKLKSISTEDTNKQNGNTESVSNDTDVSMNDGKENKETKPEETEEKAPESVSNDTGVSMKDGEENKEAKPEETEQKAPESVSNDTDVAMKDGEENKETKPGETEQKAPESVSNDTDVSMKDEEENKETKTEETEQKAPEEAAEKSPVEDAENGKEEKEADTTGADAEAEAQESEGTEESPAVSDAKENQGSTQEKPPPAADAYKNNKNVILREDLKRIFQKFGTVKFIDFKMGSESGFIRFEDASAAQKARAAAALTEKGGLVVKNFIAILDPVTGEAEREYWSLLRNSQDNWRDNFNKSHRGRGGRHHHRGGRNFGGRHSRPRENDYVGRHNKARRVGAA